MKINYIIIPFIAFIVAFGGSLLTNRGMVWYKSIHLPSWTPPGQFIGLAWTIIFILSTISALVVWNRMPSGKIFSWIIVFFILNAVLNIAWSFLFFNQHLIGAAVFDAALLGVSVISLIIFIWPFSRFASALLIPYAGWVSFATILNFIIWTLN